MNPLKYIYRKSSIKRKILDIGDEIKRLVKPYCREKYFLHWYGAYEIDPLNLVFWVCVESDRQKYELENNEPLLVQMRSLLAKHEYPAAAWGSVHIGFESQETVDRVSGGHWQYHFK